MTNSSADCQRYAADRGYEVDRVYREVESGANRQRPMYREMLGLAETGAVDVLLAWRPDRFQRNMGDAQDLIDACLFGGVRVECATQYVDLDTIPQDTAFGARERKMISVRTRAGKLGSARQGRIPSKLPYGYRRTDEGKAVLQADEAAVVERIFRMATEEDRGIRYIADVLDVAGVTPPGGKRWWPNAIARILSCTTYTGTLRLRAPGTRQGSRQGHPHHRPAGSRPYRHRRSRHRDTGDVGTRTDGR